jgi:hypothetical protein
LALLGLLQNSRGVLLGQAATDGTGLLGPEVKGQVLLVLVEEAELGPLLGVDDGQDTGDRLAEIVAVREKTPMSAKRCPCSPSRTSPPFAGRPWSARVRIDVHFVELGARGDDLLDAKLAQLRLELTELLGELVLVLRP